jgi:DNA-binding MarR family transcriptional regulator
MTGSSTPLPPSGPDAGDRHLAQHHPRHGLDEAIHSPVRLSMMAALAPMTQMEFQLLRDTIEVSDSVLSKNVTALERAGYVEVTKGHVGKRPRTWLAATDRGRRAYNDHWAALRSLVEGPRPADSEYSARAPG